MTFSNFQLERIKIKYGHYPREVSGTEYGVTTSNCTQAQLIDVSYSVSNNPLFQIRCVAITIFIVQRHKTDQILESTLIVKFNAELSLMQAK